MTSLCAIALKLIETHKKAYVVCAMTLVIRLSILDESGSNLMKNYWFLCNSNEIAFPATVVCAMTLLVEFSILDESGSNIMKNE